MGKKRRCLLWAALLALVMLVPSTGLACEHYNVSIFYDQLVPAGNRVEPQIDVPGYSGDLLCPECGQVCERGVVLPALPDPAAHPASTDAETAGGGTEQGGQEKQEAETVPGGTEGDGLKPAQPEEPSQPAGSEQPVSPSGQENQEPPVPPEEPAPQAPQVQQEEPAQQEQPVQQEQPASGGTEPEKLAAAEPVPEPPAAAEPQPPAEKPAEEKSAERPPQVKEEAAPVPVQKENGETESAGTSSGGGGGGTAKQDAEKKAPAFGFSFRRTRFKPEPGIRAEAAGKLVWPVSASPFRQTNRR